MSWYTSTIRILHLEKSKDSLSAAFGHTKTIIIMLHWTTTGDISKCLTLIINQASHSGIFPDKLKIAKFTPIHKKGDIKLMTNFRPISVLPVISKNFETLICDQLSHYLESNNLLCPQQYGFTKKFVNRISCLRSH